MKGITFVSDKVCIPTSSIKQLQQGNWKNNDKQVRNFRHV